MKTSSTGYRKDSKDNKEPYLRIPSGRISMSNVSHPILAILDDGSFEVMQPENEYKFNSKSVIEVPMKTKAKKLNDKQLKEFETYLQQLDEEDQDSLIDYIENLPDEDRYKFMCGGKVKWKKYQEGGKIPVEVEGEETVLNPKGELHEFVGPKHSEGGIDVNLEQGSRIFSEHLKAPEEVVQMVLGTKSKRKMSFADLSKRFDTTKYTKILENPKSDKYQIETSQLKLAGNRAMLETIFQAQEQLKQDQHNSKYQKGGTVSPLETPLERIKRTYDSDQQFWENYAFDSPSQDVSQQPLIKLNPEEYRRKSELKGYYPEGYTLQKTKWQDTYYDPTKKLYVKRSSPTGLYFPIELSGEQTLPKATTTLDVVDPRKASISPGSKPLIVPKTKRNKSESRPWFFNHQEEAPSLDTDIANPSLTEEEMLKVVEFDIPKEESLQVDETQIQDQGESPVSKKRGNFGISSKLAGAILDIGMAASDKLTVRNPQYRDLRKYPVFSRFVDFDDKEAGRNLALNIRQIQNSNMPESVKQARIADLNAQYRDYIAKVDFGNAQRYQAKLEGDTEKLQQYINSNIDQQYQDIERYNAQKARVDFLRDQFNAQRKSRMFNAFRGYLDYVDTVGMQNQLYAENYRINPFTGKVVFTGDKKDPLREREEQLAEYAQRSNSARPLDKGFTMLGNGKGVIIDDTGKATIVDFTKQG